MLDVRARKQVSRAVDPIARVVAKTRLTPTAVTLLGLTFSIGGAVLIAGVYLLERQRRQTDTARAGGAS